MKQKLLTNLFLLPVLLLSVTVFADSVTFSGTVETTDLDTSVIAPGCTPQYQKIIPFSVTETGSYDIINFTPVYNGADNFVYAIVNTIATVNFDPRIVEGRNSAERPPGVLNAGVQYYMHIGGSTVCFQSSYPLPYDFTLTGPGDICVNNVCPAGNTITTTTFVSPPDDRINWQYGDLHAVLYRVSDSAGEAAIDVYCWDGENSWLGMRADSSSESGTGADGCNLTFYVLPDGGYQFNIYFDGKLYEIVCEDFACQEPERRYYDPGE